MMPGKGKQSPKGRGNGKQNGKGQSGRHGKEGGSSSGKGRDGGGAASPDCTLTLPNIKAVDHAKALPRFTAVLSRTEEEGVGMEDLDTLQMELETLLSSVAVRARTLQGEVDIINSAEDKKWRTSLSKPPGSPGKRGKHHEDRPTKKFKDHSGKAKDVSAPASKPPKSKPAPPPKSAPAATASSAEVDHLPEHHLPPLPDLPPRPPPPKNDVPNKFWLSVEPYCADIAPDDVRLLEDLIRTHVDDAEFQKIPLLGKHYTVRWAQEDLADEQKEGGKAITKRRGTNTGVGTGVSSSSMSEAETILRRAAEKSGEFGPLTQRLVSALIEERISAMEDGDGDPDGSERKVKLSVGAAASLERRLKRELEEQGILDVADEPTMAQDQANDEILQELRRCQAEQKALSQHNLQQLQRLLKMAKDQVARQELKQKLKIADGEVMEAYRRIAAAHQKKKPPTKKEKEQAWKALRDREAILKQLDSTAN